MSQNLYIATMEPRSGKSLVVLGIMELLSRRVQKLGFFRPVIRGGDDLDNDIELVRRRYNLAFPSASLSAVTYDEAQHIVADGQSEALLKRILTQYKALEQQCDVVVCEGTDFTGVSAAFEFEFNAQVANHLGCPVLIVANGAGKSPAEVVDTVRAARESFATLGCTVTATIVNRADAVQIDSLMASFQGAWPHPDPVFVVPEEPTLGQPTVGDVAAVLQVQRLYGEDPGLQREVLSYKIAAMQVANFLGHVEDGSLIITPGDRADIIISALATVYANSYPNLAGIVLTGGFTPDAHVQRLLDGLRQPTVPIFTVDTDTYTTAVQVHAVHPRLTPDNERKIASALGVFEASVDVAALAERIAVTRPTSVTPLMFEYELLERAKAPRQHIVLPEGTEDRILQASEILLRRNVVDLTLLGNVQEIRDRMAALGIDLKEAQLVDPAHSPWLEDYAQTYFELRKHKGMTADTARDVMLDVSFFGTMMVYKGDADAMVSGAVHTTGHTIRPALEFIRTQPGCSLVSSVFFMCLADRVLVYGDCAVNPEPTPEQLADIAISSAATAAMFGIEPCIAMLSYSTGESGHGQDVDKVREATHLAQTRRPDLKIEGPIQYDAAVDSSVAEQKLPGSAVAGQATVFIFPDLNTGNNTYKAVQRSANAVAIGPVLQGLNQPVNDLSRGCLVADIVNTVAITAIQAQAKCTSDRKGAS